jgi:hypothetical protein
MLLFKRDYVMKLLRSSNVYIAFIIYKHVNNIKSYSTLCIYSYLANANKHEIIAAIEILLRITVIEGIFTQMQNGEAHLNFQESQTYINELII